MFRHLQDDYRKAIDGLTEDVSALSEELETLRSSPQPAPTTSAPAPPTTKAPESTSRPAPQQYPPPPPVTPAGPAPSWATVVRKGRKKAPAPKPSAPLVNTSTSPKAPVPKKGPTMTERRLTIKCDGSPLSPSFDTTATEITTYTTGPVLTQHPRWLTSNDSRANQSASTVVISITSPKAPLFIGKRLASFSSTYRTERCLRFNSFTQCSNCHSFGHHSTECSNPATCRWCTISHPTGERSCPTATYRVRGLPCTLSTTSCL